MTAPQRTTPNPGTVERPERSSRRVSRKSPMGWLPWALIGALAALLALTLLLINAVDDDGPEGSAGDSLGQLSGEDGDSAIGSDGEGGSGSDATGQPGGQSGGTGAGGGDPLVQVSEKALVGGGSLQPGPTREVAGASALAQQPGVAGAVLFAEGSAEVDAAGQQVVAATVSSLRDAGVTAVQVVGHTDVVAGDPVNDTLSQERADAVAQALGSQLPGVDVTTAARGDDEPVASNDDEAGRQLNRRAVITATA